MEPENRRLAVLAAQGPPLLAGTRPETPAMPQAVAGAKPRVSAGFSCASASDAVALIKEAR